MGTPSGFAHNDSLGVLSDYARRGHEAYDLAKQHLDPSLVQVLHILGFDRNYTRAQGSYLYDSEGRAYLDFHTGEGFASLGHNHPDVKEVLRAALDADLSDGVQIHYSALSGLLAEELTRRLPAPLDAVFFTSSGAETVDSAMKFARAATRRPRFISCDQGYHGINLGPLSLSGEDMFKEGFGPLLPGCERIPFGDLDALKEQLRRKDVAAFICEPIQGRTVNIPRDDFLPGAQELCRKYGSLFILDEIQTGLGRTGKLFALEHWGLEPDFVLVAKALSGGFMPVGAMITRREIHSKVVGTLDRCYVHQSTYGRNRLAMAAGLASLRIIERDGIVQNAARMGALLLDGLERLKSKYEMVKEVRGKGLIIGIELGPPRSMGARLNWRLIHMASEGLFPQLIVIPLHRDHGVITMAAGKNDVIKLLPPLTLSEPEARAFLSALDDVLAECHGSASKNWGLIREIAQATIVGRSSSRPVTGGPTVDSPGRTRRIDITRDNGCLVTGATGFIGGHIVERLRKEGYEVRCLVRKSSNTSFLEKLDVEIVRGDLTDAPSLRQAVDGCRFVFHCGAMVTDWGTGKEIQRANVKGTRNVLEAAAQAEVDRFIHISTTDVYGYPGGEAVDETHPPSPVFRNWYSHTKMHAESEVRRYERERGLPVVILRPATVYGPRSVNVVGELAKAIRSGRMLLVDGGRAVAGLCYIDNLLDAALLALRHEHAVGEAFNVSDGTRVTWKKFTDGIAAGLGCPPVRRSARYPVANAIGFSLESGYRLLRKVTGIGIPPLLSRQAVQVLGTNQDFSIQKAQRILGYEPRVDFPSGLAATMAWVKAEVLS